MLISPDTSVRAVNDTGPPEEPYATFPSALDAGRPSHRVGGWRRCRRAACLMLQGCNSWTSTRLWRSGRWRRTAVYGNFFRRRGGDAPRIVKVRCWFSVYRYKKYRYEKINISTDIKILNFCIKKIHTDTVKITKKNSIYRKNVYIEKISVRYFGSPNSTQTWWKVTKPCWYKVL